MVSDRKDAKVHHGLYHLKKKKKVINRQNVRTQFIWYRIRTDDGLLPTGS
jgi:hypothetical protein